MAPVRFKNGRAQRGEQPLVLVAAAWEIPATAATARAAARELAAEGFSGLAVAGNDAACLALAVDAARRAGLALLVAAAEVPVAPHVAAWRPAEGWAEDVATAYALALSGAPQIVGPPDEVAGLARYLAWFEQPAELTPGAAAGWLLASSAQECGAFTADGGELTLEVAPDQALHWIDPESGDLLAVSQTHGDEPQTVRLPPGEAMALYVGPLRYTPDETPTRP